MYLLVVRGRGQLVACSLAGNLGRQRNKEMKEVRPLSSTLSATFSRYFGLDLVLKNTKFKSNDLAHCIRHLPHHHHQKDEEGFSSKLKIFVGGLEDFTWLKMEPKY